MKHLNFKLLAAMIAVFSIGFLSSCDEDDDVVQPATSQNNGNGTGGGTGGGSNDTTSVAVNTMEVGNNTINLGEYTVTKPINSGSTNNDIRLDIFVEVLNRSKGYWVIGLHELPTANGTLTSNFTYHWQNLPQGKFYFNKVKDASGGEWWYTDSQDITMNVEVSGDFLTLSCNDINVGDSFLPNQVNNTETVSVRVKMKISDITGATSAGTIYNLVD